MSNFKKDEAAVLVFTLDDCKFYVRTCLNSEQVRTELDKMNGKFSTLCITDRFDRWQEAAVYKDAICGMLNMNHNELTDDQVEWAMMKQLDDEVGYSGEKIKEVYDRYNIQYKRHFIKKPDTSMSGISARGRQLIKELL